MKGIGVAGWIWSSFFPQGFTDISDLILEGIVTVLAAVVALFAMYDFPEMASFLTEEERDFIVHRLKI